MGQDTKLILEQALTALTGYRSKAEHRRTSEDDRLAERAIAALRQALGGVSVQSVPAAALTEQQAHHLGAYGAEPTEAERLLFEAWMRGHCWAVVGDWTGGTYQHPQESSGFVHGGAMATRRLWAAWRDRAALSQLQQATPTI